MVRGEVGFLWELRGGFMDVRESGVATYLLDMGIQAAAQGLRVEGIARQDSCGHWRNRRNRRNGCDRNCEAAIRKCRIHDAIAESRWEEKTSGRDGGSPG